MLGKSHYSWKMKHFATILFVFFAVSLVSAQNNLPNYDVRYMKAEWSVDPLNPNIVGKIHYNIGIKLVDDESITLVGGKKNKKKGSVTHLVKDIVCFQLSDSLIVDSVWSIGQKLGFEHKNNLLQVSLDKDEFVCRTKSHNDNYGLVSISIAYHGKALKKDGSYDNRISKIDTVLWTLSEPYGMKDWWPVVDERIDRIDSMDVFITAPKQYVAASNGVLVNETVEGNMRTTHWKTHYPIVPYLVAIAVGNYQVSQQNILLSNGASLPIVTYAYKSNNKFARDANKNTQKYIHRLEQLFGPYPFRNEKYGHVQIGFLGGMEHQTITFAGVVDEQVVVHELAHQWWGDFLSCATWQHVWINEGFATYSEYLAYETENNHLKLKEWKKENLYYGTRRKEGSVFKRDTTDDEELFDKSLTYSKAGYVLHMLRKQIGDSAFFATIRTLPTKYVSQNNNMLTTSQVQKAFEQVADTSLTAFFNNWVYGEGFPIYNSQFTQNGDTLTIQISQTTTHPSVSFYAMKVDVLLIGENIAKLITLHHTTPTQTFTIEPGFKVKRILLDPNDDILKDYRIESQSF